MREKEFEDLIKRSLSGQATEEEAALVQKWLDRRAGEDPFSKLSASEKEKIKSNIFNRFSSRARLGARRAKEESGRAVIRFYRVAAAIVVVSVLSYTLLKLGSHSVQERITLTHSVSSSPEESKKVILSDSSIVWLKGNSAITYPERFEGIERNVELSGEALFEVSRNPENPFIIQCGDLTARVLGTSFNIKSSDTDVEVLVLTGKVELSSKGNRNGLVVHPNEKVIYDQAQNHMAKVMVKDDEKTAKISGTQYTMRFHATRMEEIIRRIEDKFDVTVSLSDPRLKNCTITGDFTDQSLDRTLSMICLTLETEYEISRSRVMLKGDGCD